MPVTHISFGWPGYPPTPEAVDIHLLRGQSTDELRKQLWVQDVTGDEWKPLSDYEGGDIEIEFVPVFKIERDATVAEYDHFGIRVHKTTGKVTVNNGWTPAGSPHNFILEAFIADNGTGIPWIKIPSATIRIHVHLNVTNLWLTPALLSVRRQQTAGHEEYTSVQFTIRAQFDDGTVGDISSFDDFTFTPAQWFLGRWIRIPASAGDTAAPFTIRAQASAKWNGKSAEAKLELLPSWATEPNVPTADLIEGRPGVWDGSVKPESVPNIVFLGCGFTAAEQATFRMVADTIVHKVKTDPLLQPFGYLSTSMNYWALMFPAPEAGVSVRCDVQQVMEGGQLFARLVPWAELAPPAAVDWNVSHLIYMAGLPVPSDLGLVRQIDPAQPAQPPQPIATMDALRELPLAKLDFQLLFDRWKAIMRLDDPVHMIASIPRNVVWAWIVLADRTFIDEVNGFPAVCVGALPAASRKETGLLTLHPFRLHQDADSDTAISDFFRRVTATPRNGITVSLDDGGAAQPGLGHLWAEDRPAFAFDNRDFIVALSNSTDGRASIRVPGVQSCLNVSAVDQDGKSFPVVGSPVTRDPARNALRLSLPGPDLMLRYPTWRVFAHELAHTFGLGDEYSQTAERFAGPESDLNWAANLMSEEGARVAGEAEKIDVDLIKWNWHRIRKAAVVTLPIDNRADGTFRVFVRKGGGVQFEPGDYVRLRQRTPRIPINRDPKTSNVEFRVESIHAENLNNTSDPFNMTVVIKNESPLVDTDPFGPGSLIYLPVPTPLDPPPAFRPYLTMVSPLAERVMSKIGGSMTGTTCEIEWETMWNGLQTQTPIIGLPDPDIVIPPQQLPELVGAYFGGSYACGVLHPTGQCMMRNDWDEQSTFCPVCRYVLVEQINPEKHWDIDREYEKKYRM